MAPLDPKVDDSETLVRVIKSPFHLKGKKLKKQAFQPPRTKQDLSVIRQVMGDDFCKNKGVELLAQATNAKYQGLATGLTMDVRRLSAKVIDYPQDFMGHAHIVSFAAHSPDEPHSPEVMEKLDNYYAKMVEHFLYHPDPKPEVAGWYGPSLKR
ncbi:hypothetical protein ELQ94_07925 [Labedella endophytica]|uniref:Uncharacterized protein n=1 Tax=Labedella endophytica TaxID=1523160 RepID=A0A433JSW4_9MICO|nr:hypothetical protein ELQ94_07925 [Labedella endophytica]